MKKNNNKDSKKDLKYCVIASILTMNITFIVLSSIFFLPFRRKNNKYNLFSKNDFCISDEEVENIYNELEEKFRIDIVSSEKDEYLLLDAIDKNESFNKNKNYLYKQLFELFKDNQYLCKEEVYESLLNLTIYYNKIKPFYINKNTKGVYLSNLNSIGTFTKDSNLEVLFHELIHCIFNNCDKLPRFFVEGMAELLTNEYFSNTLINKDQDTKSPFVETYSYIFEVSAVKMLCELTSPDIVLKSYTLNNMDYIIDNLTSLYGSREKVVKAIDILGEVLDSLDSKTKTKYSLEEIYCNCMKIFDDCINNKYDNENDKISYYYNENLFYNCLFGGNCLKNYLLDIERFGIDYKVYFANNLKTSINSYYDESNDMKKNEFSLLN